MGIYTTSPPTVAAAPHSTTRKLFLTCNYALLAAASSSVFLTLSLRLIPSLCGLLFILLHLLTLLGALAGCSAANTGDRRRYAAHVVAAVLTAVFQGSLAVVIFAGPRDFLARLDSYVQENEGVKILRLVGGLCAVVFCLEWLVLTLAFFLKYYAVADAPPPPAQQEAAGSWPPFKVQV